MTPEEFWLTSRSGSDMMDGHEVWLEQQTGSRKAALLVIAHARRVWPSLVEADWNDSRGSCRPLIGRCAAAIEVCERVLEGQVSAAEPDAALAEIEDVDRRNHGPFLSLAVGAASDYALTALNGEYVSCYSLNHSRVDEIEQYLAHLLRDIFGNPFQPVSFSPDWRTDTAVSLARQMYDSREFGAMPILADALQDAGCDSEDILNHCRDANQVHVRGCWVVDLVLGKE
jgi:hypothetical protein